MNRRTLLLFVFISAAAGLAGALLARVLDGGPQIALTSGTALPARRSLAAFHLTDADGRDFDLGRLQGHPTLLFFGFTNCPDVCPTTLATLSQVERAAPLPSAQVVFVSIDPQRDTAAQLRAYLNAFSSDFVGVRGDNTALAPLLQSLSAIAVRENLPGGGYTMDHSATLYLLDTHGRLAAVFQPPFSASALDSDLRRMATAL